MQTISEGKASILAPTGELISKRLEVFYNPLMELNRSMSLLVLLASERTSLIVADPLAGTGIRSLRILTELPPDTISSLLVNDIHQNFNKYWTANAELSGISSEKVCVSTLEASEFLLSTKGADYIDIDPFGSPNPFLDAAIKKIRRGGILAVTATDTAPLCGTYPKACVRKYWSVPRRDDMMHEAGLRILIRKCQLIGAQYDKALTPLLSYSKDHYFRIFFVVHAGKQRVDAVLEQHGMWDAAGPLWKGSLFQQEFVERMLKVNPFPSLTAFMTLLAKESAVSTMGFYDIHTISRDLSLRGPPRTEALIDALRKEGYNASRTHLVGHGVRTNCQEKRVMELCKEHES